MAYQFNTLEKKIADSIDAYRAEVVGIHTGRATPSLLDSVKVEQYGSRLGLNQVANLTVEDARTIRVVPWDVSQITVIEKSVTDAHLGVSTGSDEKGVRVSFPELTSERREQLIKLIKSKLETARIALRQHRDNVWTDIQKGEKDGVLSEDEKFRAKDDMQALIDKGNKALEDIAAAKEQELRS